MTAATRPLLSLLIATLLFAAALELHWTMVSGTEVYIPIRADAREYYAAALNLARYGTLSTRLSEAGDPPPPPDSLRRPGYPLFLAPLVEFPPTAEMLRHIVRLQAVVGAVTVLLAFAAFRAFLGRPYALAAALLTAASPHLLSADVYLLTETLFTGCLTLFAWSLTRLARRPSPGWALLTGATLALTLLVRETTAYYLPFLLAALPLLKLPRRRAVQTGIFIVAAFATVYAPWPLRNLAIPAAAAQSNQAVDSIHGGIYPGLMYDDLPESRGMPHRFDPHYGEMRDFPALLAELKRRFAAEPGRYLYWYLVGKPLMFLSWDEVAGSGDVFVYPVIAHPFAEGGPLHGVHRAMHALHWPLTALALVGALLFWLPSAGRELPPAVVTAGRLCSVLLLYFLLVHVATTPLPRYATPIRPLLFGMALFAVAQAVAAVRGRRKGAA